MSKTPYPNSPDDVPRNVDSDLKDCLFADLIPSETFGGGVPNDSKIDSEQDELPIEKDSLPSK